MTTDYSFIEAFSTKLSDPDLFDAGAAVSGAADQFFVELGTIAKLFRELSLFVGGDGAEILDRWRSRNRQLHRLMGLQSDDEEWQSSLHSSCR